MPVTSPPPSESQQMTTHLCAGSSPSGQRGHPPPWSSLSCMTSDCRRRWCLHPAPSGTTVGGSESLEWAVQDSHRIPQHQLALSRYQMEQAWTSCQKSFNLPLQHKEETSPEKAQSHACQRLSQKGRTCRSRAQLGTGLTWMLWVSPWSQPPLLSFCLSGRHQKGLLA